MSLKLLRPLRSSVISLDSYFGPKCCMLAPHLLLCAFYGMLYVYHFKDKKTIQNALNATSADNNRRNNKKIRKSSFLLTVGTLYVWTVSFVEWITSSCSRGMQLRNRGTSATTHSCLLPSSDPLILGDCISETMYKGPYVRRSLYWQLAALDGTSIHVYARSGHFSKSPNR